MATGRLYVGSGSQGLVFEDSTNQCRRVIGTGTTALPGTTAGSVYLANNAVGNNPARIYWNNSVGNGFYHIGTATTSSGRPNGSLWVSGAGLYHVGVDGVTYIHAGSIVTCA